MSRIDDVINWDEAMVQAGEDEEFLRELLVDFREELLAQITKINVAMGTPILINIQSAAHVIKGAAANLMCEPLRVAAYNLELIAKRHPASAPITADVVANLNSKFDELKEATNRYMHFLDVNGI